MWLLILLLLIISFLSLSQEQETFIPFPTTYSQPPFAYPRYQKLAPEYWYNFPYLPYFPMINN